MEATIKEREHILANQRVQLVQGQVEKNFSHLQADPKQTIFPMAHLALLNRKTDQMDASGWVHNEANEMADMHEIFKAFAGKTLIFDGKGPCLDAEGHLHMAQTLLDQNQQLKQMKLETHFANLSVQGHTKNDGIQQTINQEGLASLIHLANQKAQKMPKDQEIQEGRRLLLDIQIKLQAGQSDYEVAEDFSVALLKLHLAFSMGCLSAKDRTGYVGARAILRFVNEGMDDHPRFKVSLRL